MSLSIFSTIAEGMNTYFGASWITLILIGVGLGALFFAILRVPVLIALATVGIIFIILTIAGVIIGQSWGLGIAVLLLGIILALAISKLFIR